MTETDTPYQNIGAQMQGLGTAPAIASIDLAEEIPVAVNPNEVDREATRYIGFAGDIIGSSQKRERPDLRIGGEYLGQQYRTLIRSKGLVRRCQITPMEMGFDFFSADMLGDDANLHVVTTVSHDENGRGALQASPAGALNGVRVYPGDELKSVLAGERNNTSKGIVEFASLAGTDYADFKASGMQTFLFPQWNEIALGVESLPNKISELEAHFKERKGATTDTTIRSVCDDWLRSCDIYRTWGTGYLKTASQLVKVPAYQGFVHTYSEIAEMLFVQLEIRREDLISTDRDIAEIVAKAQTGNSISGAEASALLARMVDSQELLTKVLLAQQQGSAATPPVATIMQCGATTKAGAACSIPARENGYCGHHQPVGEEGNTVIEYDQ